VKIRTDSWIPQIKGNTATALKSIVQGLRESIPAEDIHGLKQQRCVSRLSVVTRVKRTVGFASIR
jgi:hypothetical protein